MLTIKDDANGKSYVDQVQDAGNIDYIENGTLYKNSPCKSVLVTGQSELVSLAGYSPGTVAFTAGFKSMWQLSASGEWVSV